MRGDQVTDEDKKQQAQVVAVYLAVAFCCFMPIVRYVGEIYCKLHGIEPPDIESTIKCCLVGVGAVIAWGFPGVSAVVAGLVTKLFGKNKDESKQ